MTSGNSIEESPLSVDVSNSSSDISDRFYFRKDLSNSH